jgi:hypothetical protein
MHGPWIHDATIFQYSNSFIIMTLAMILFPARWSLTLLTTQIKVTVVIDQSTSQASAQVSISELATRMITVLK